MPCMPRHNLRTIAYDIKALMKKHKIPYEYEWFPVALYKMSQHLYIKGKKYSEDRAKRAQLKKE